MMTTNQLCAEYKAYCELHGLHTDGDASELLAELQCYDSHDAHVAWLKEFISRWEVVSDAD